MASEKPSTSSGTISTNILVHPRQRNNPVLGFVKKVAYEFRDDLLADFVVGQSACCLFLSLRYHQAQPQYILKRLNDLRNLFTVRILFVQVDIKDAPPVIREINRIALQARVTFMPGWSAQDIGQYLELYKILENKQPDLIKERIEMEPLTRAIAAITTIKSVNKTDAMELLENFGSLKKIAEASIDEMSVVPGIGERKAKQIYETLREPLVYK